MRKIIHIDMDCFYAAIEEREHPELKGKPIAVGGPSQHRGVLCTANYEARQYGLRSAMATAHAFKLCPQLNLLPGHFSLYREVSQQIRAIFHEYTDLVEPLSLDEAYLDVTDCKQFNGSATRIAREIRDRIYQEQQLTASAGISVNKFLAKVASDWRKPNGQFVIPPAKVNEFITALPVAKIFGVGKVTQQTLEKMGVITCHDLQQIPLEQLIQRFGKFGIALYKRARGEDERDVQSDRQRKSLSVEHTYPQDLANLEACHDALPDLIVDLKKRLTPHLTQYKINKLMVKVKFHDFEMTTVETRAHEIDPTQLNQLLQAGFNRGNKPVRLLGIGVGFDKKDSSQLALGFDATPIA